MASQTLTQPHQSQAAPTLPGTWKLDAGRAVTLHPRESGVLKVAHGRVWATYDGPHRGRRNNLGDYIVGAGAQLRLRADERLVLETWNGGSAAYFSWEPAPVPTVVARLAPVLQPLADLRQALALGLGAVGRLAVGLVRVVTHSTATPNCDRHAHGAPG